MILVFDLVHSITLISEIFWLSAIFGCIGLGLVIVIIRMNMRHRNTKSTLKISSRRGEHVIALRPEDVREAKQLIWKSRKDVSKLGFIDPTTEEHKFV